MLCQNLMKRSVEVVYTNDSVEEAARRMRDFNIGFVPVVERETGRVVGTLTDRDIAIRLVAESGSGYALAQAIMTPEVVSCRPYDDVRRAEWLMSHERKSRIMVIDDAGTLCGVISLSDIAHRGDPRAAETLRNVARREAQA